MRDRPPLCDAAIKAALLREYGIESAELTFLPLGYDADARVFRVDCDKASYFLKVRATPPKRAAMLAPRHLQAQGIRAAVAPIATASGQSVAGCEDFFLILYPWIAGQSAMDQALSPDQWRRWGEILRAIHSAAIDETLSRILPREQFGVKWLARFDGVLDALDEAQPVGDFALKTAALWREKAELIDNIRARYIDLGERFRVRASDLVLCHADSHQANLLLDAAGELHIVDWEEVILAPKERDLMFFIRDGHAPEELAAFFAGYGGADYDRIGLAYYKFDWVMQELCDFGERLLLPSNASDAQLARDLAEFRRLFAPGDVINRAYQALEDCGS